MSGPAYISILKLLLLVLATGYLGLMLFALLFANRLLFPAPPPGYRDSPDMIKLAANERGEQVTLAFLDNPHSSFLIFYHHGNGEDLQGILPRLEALRGLGFAVLAWDYPGYGTSDGKPTERGINEAAERIWQAIPERFNYAHDQIILYGRSLGGGPSVYLASRHEPAGLILEGVFTSVFRVGLPIRLLPWDIFDNYALIADINCPSLFVHGTDDRTVPFKHARQLFEKAPQPKFFSWLSGAGHNDLVDGYSEIYYSSIVRFREFLLHGEE